MGRSALGALAAALGALLLAGCATSGLQAAGRLGDAGGAATLQARNAYTRSSDVLGGFTRSHCQSYPLTANESVLAQQPLCPYLRGEAASTQAARDIAALRQLIDERARFYGALNAYYTNFSATARLDPVKLTDATKSVAAIANSIATLTGTSFPFGQEALQAAGAQLEALVQILEENHRLNSLKESSADIRLVLPVIVATYTVEQRVLQSIAQANANERATQFRAYSDMRVMDSATVLGRAQLNAPVLPYNAQTATAWNTARGRAYVLNTALLQDREALDQAMAENATVIDSLQRLRRLHEQFETSNTVTNEDVAVLMSRINTIANGPASAPAPATQPPASP